jgi:hypothetical protein
MMTAVNASFAQLPFRTHHILFVLFCMISYHASGGMSLLFLNIAACNVQKLFQMEPEWPRIGAVVGAWCRANTSRIVGMRYVWSIQPSEVAAVGCFAHEGTK